MKSFLEWFKASTKIKRWILLILVGIVLTCYGIAKVLVSEEITFFELGKTIAIFVMGFIAIIIGIVFIQKRSLEIIIDIPVTPPSSIVLGIKNTSKANAATSAPIVSKTTLINILK